MVNENIKKNGTATMSGSYILEGNVSYIEQEEKENDIVRVVTVDGKDEKVPINKLERFIEDLDTYNDVKRELKVLAAIISGNDGNNERMV